MIQLSSVLEFKNKQKNPFKSYWYFHYDCTQISFIYSCCSYDVVLKQVTIVSISLLSL